MDVSSFFGSAFLKHSDLPLPHQIWTIGKVDQQLVGNEQKVGVSFAEYPNKALSLNNTNGNRLKALYGDDTNAWLGRQLQVYRTQTSFKGEPVLCVRVCGCNEEIPEVVLDMQWAPVNTSVRQSPPVVAPVQTPTPAPQQPSPVVAPAQTPTAALQQQVDPTPPKNPWEQNPSATQQNNPPSA